MMYQEVSSFLRVSDPPLYCVVETVERLNTPNEISHRLRELLFHKCIEVGFVSLSVESLALVRNELVALLHHELREHQYVRKPNFQHGSHVCGPAEVGKGLPYLPAFVIKFLLHTKIR